MPTRILTSETRITLRVKDYTHETTLGHFLADNSDGELDVPAIRAALAIGRRYNGGGGAEASWSVEVAR